MIKEVGKTSRYALFALVIVAVAACSDNEAPAVDDAPSEAVSETVTPDRSSAGQAPGQTTRKTQNEPREPALSQPGSVPVTDVEDEPAAEVSETTAEKPQQHVVKGVVTQWAPMVLFVKPGDQIVFKQMTGHDTETIDGMIPDGAATWKSKLGAEGFAVTVDVPGVYVYKCNPHVSLGMIGAIVVGDLPPPNLQQLEQHPQNKGMIGRTIRKLKQALEARPQA